MKLIARTVLICSLLLGVIPPILAQYNFKMTGTVNDEKNEPLPGVNIKIPGKNVGTITDYNGNFTIIVPNENSTLTFTYIGYQPKAIIVGKNRTLIVQLKEDSKMMDEVVVVGYGTMKKSDLTGSVGSVKLGNIEEKSYSNLQQAIGGKVAGVVVNENSGEPGAGLSIEIRGGASLNYSTEPLYVIDGIPFDVPQITGGSTFAPGTSTSPIAGINPNDIASIEILKDASATAIYGSRGANGVVLITTKQGTEGKPKISINYSHGLSNPQKQIDVLNASDYAHFVNECKFNRSTNPTDPSYVPPFTADELASIPNYNHQAEVSRTGQTKDLNITLSGGTKTSKYYISAQYFNQQGVILNSQLDRYNAKFNYDIEITPKLKLSNSITLTRTTQNGTSVGSFGGSFLYSAAAWAPTAPLINPDGTYNILNNYMYGDKIISDLDWGTIYYKERYYSSVLSNINTNIYGFHNPLAQLLDYTNNNTTTQILANSSLSYTINKQLTLNARLGVTSSNGLVENYRPTTVPVVSTWKGMAYLGNSESLKMLYESTINYTNNFGKHYINGVLGATAEKYEVKTFSTSTQGFTQDITGPYLIEAGSLLQSPNSFYSGNQLLSLLGRINYHYNYKYYITLSGRYDGSSKFAEGHRFGFFPSGAVSWRVSKEKFMEDLTFVSDFKLRASYGVTGNQAVDSYNTLALLGAGDKDANNKYNTSFGGVVNIGYAPKGVPNKELTWEQTEQANAGIDISLFKNRIIFTAEVYNRYTSNLLYNVELPWSTGFKNMSTNIGEISNRGLELSLSTVNIQTKKFSWKTDFNIGWNKNRVEKLTGVEGYSVPIPATGTIATYLTLLEAGKSIGDIMGYETLPVWNAESLATKPTQFQPGVKEGYRRYKDQNGDGVLNDNDRVLLGNALPIFTGGFNNSFSFYNIDISAFFTFSYGNKIVNQFSTNFANMSGERNVNQKDYDNRYINITPDMDEATVTRITENNSITHYQVAGSTVDVRELSDLIVEDGSFIRCKEIAVGYTLPKGIVQKLYMTSIHLFANVQNPFTITNYTGPNAESTSTGLARGIDSGSYPLARSFKFGVNFNF